MPLPALLRLAVATLAAGATLHAWAAGVAPTGLFTILDGSATVLRDTRQFAAAEGLRLQGDDIVRTGAETRLARIELADGSTLDLGPATELLLQPALAGPIGERAATLYLARGWLKIGSANGHGVASGGLDVARLAGTAVLRIAPDATLVFLESGNADLIERGDGHAGRSQPLKDGDAYARRGMAAGNVLKRPPTDLLQGLPRAFVDSLPSRAARFGSVVVEPGNANEVDYADASPWINGEAVLRPHFLARFGALARDRQFRASLVAELRAHPEWDRLLFPEKYRPKPVVVVKRPAPAAPAAPAPVPETTPVALSLQNPMPWLRAARTEPSNTLVETR